MRNGPEERPRPRSPVMRTTSGTRRKLPGRTPAPEVSRGRQEAGLAPRKQVSTRSTSSSPNGRHPAPRSLENNTGPKDIGPAVCAGGQRLPLTGDGSGEAFAALAEHPEAEIDLTGVLSPPRSQARNLIDRQQSRLPSSTPTASLPQFCSSILDRGPRRHVSGGQQPSVRPLPSPRPRTTWTTWTTLPMKSRPAPGNSGSRGAVVRR
jgi:hypothetical protein